MKFISSYFFLINLVINCSEIKSNLYDTENVNSYKFPISLPVDRNIIFCQHNIFCANSLIFFFKFFTLTTLHIPLSWIVFK